MKIIIPKPGEPASQADPFILKADGRFYIYSTDGEGVNVYASDALTEGWQYKGKALSVAGQHQYWAPCVHRYDGKFYMYYSSFPVETDDVHEGRIKVAVSDRPEGPFAFVRDLCEPFSIDAEIAENETGLYMFYCVNDYEGARAGTHIVVDRMLSPTEPAGDPKPVVMPSIDEEIFQRDRFKKGQHWHTIEGASYFREKNRHYLLYSGNCYENPDYFVGLAVADGGDDLTKLNFKKYPSADVYAPLIRRNEFEEGTGHNSVIREGDTWYMVYHARDVGNRMPYDTRTARIAEIVIENGIPKVERM